jgi:lipoprotein-anchoring transpeptidase ErfK/SrfK
MLRTRFLAMACLAAFALSPAWAGTPDPKMAPLAASENRSSGPLIVNADLKSAIAELKADGIPSDAGKATGTTDAKPSMPADAPASSEAAPATDAAKPAAPLAPTLTAKIDLAAQRISISEYGTEKYSWPISSGTADHPTPRGTFRPQWTAKMWFSRKYDNAPMPHAVFIHDGVAIHATYATGMLGRPASHGCIRLAPANAASFYKLVGKHGTKMTKVSIYGTPKWRSPAVASRRDGGEVQPRRAAQYQQYQQYQQAQQKSSLGSWFFDTPKYRPTAAYGYQNNRVYRRPPPPRGYRYADQMPARAYRSNGGSRVYYVQQQRAPRRVYHYNRNASGW